MQVLPCDFRSRPISAVCFVERWPLTMDREGRARRLSAAEKYQGRNGAPFLRYSEWLHLAAADRGRLSDSVYFRVKFSPDRFAINRRIVHRTIHSLRRTGVHVGIRRAAPARVLPSAALPPPLSRRTTDKSYFQRDFRKFDLTGVEPFPAANDHLILDD